MKSSPVLVGAVLGLLAVLQISGVQGWSQHGKKSVEGPMLGYHSTLSMYYTPLCTFYTVVVWIRQDCHKKEPVPLT